MSTQIFPPMEGPPSVILPLHFLTKLVFMFLKSDLHSWFLYPYFSDFSTSGFLMLSPRQIFQHMFLHMDVQKTTPLIYLLWFVFLTLLI